LLSSCHENTSVEFPDSRNWFQQVLPQIMIIIENVSHMQLHVSLISSETNCTVAIKLTKETACILTTKFEKYIV